MNIRPITSTPKAIAFGADEETKTKKVKKASTRTTHARLNKILGLEASQVRFVETPPHCFNGYTAVYFDHTTKGKINNVLMPDDPRNSIIINYNDKHPRKKPDNVTIHATSRTFRIYPNDLAKEGIKAKAAKVLEHLRNLVRSY